MVRPQSGYCFGPSPVLSAVISLSCVVCSWIKDITSSQMPAAPHPFRSDRLEGVPVSQSMYLHPGGGVVSYNGMANVSLRQSVFKSPGSWVILGFD